MAAARAPGGTSAHSETYVETLDIFERSAANLFSAERFWWATEVVFRGFDYAATFSWALSGAVLAARRGYDLTGIFAIALVSSCGGGLLRDAIFLQAGPPALVRSPAYLLIALLASLGTWLLGVWQLGRWHRPLARLATVLDALGLGAFAVVGTRLALAAGIGVVGALLIGVVNAVGGGLLRNLLLRQAPEVLAPGKLTALAAFAGTAVYSLLALWLGVGDVWAGGVTIALVAALRGASLRYGLSTRAVWSVEARKRFRRALVARSASVVAARAAQGNFAKR
jgi:uncharacterized membrane protein YeiH